MDRGAFRCRLTGLMGPAEKALIQTEHRLWYVPLRAKFGRAQRPMRHLTFFANLLSAIVCSDEALKPLTKYLRPWVVGMLKVLGV